ncbi:DUF1272 domain-containing protein [Rosenbergiella nectarea]|uniref:DUF1272 domain-containing protein n=1 Tax=Rosenbergiella nectarea TaxID=988801 RepID=UPI0034DF5F27
MLALRPNCGSCDSDLPAESKEAYIVRFRSIGPQTPSDRDPNDCRRCPQTLPPCPILLP